MNPKKKLCAERAIPTENSGEKLDAGWQDNVNKTLDSRINFGSVPIRTWNERFTKFRDTETPHILFPWIPIGAITTIYGMGGAGKTLVMLWVALHLALGRNIIGQKTEKKIRTLFISGEDNEMQFSKRLMRMTDRIGIVAEDLDVLDANLILPDVSRESMVMVQVGEVYHNASSGDRECRAGKLMKSTAFFDKLGMLVKSQNVDMVVLDPISDIFTENENDRQAVSQFLHELQVWAAEMNIAVVLIGHPGKAADSEYSGSTAWHNKSRSRIWLEPKKEAGTVIMHHRKTSWEKEAEDVVFEWSTDGVLVEMIGDDLEERLEQRRVLVERKILSKTSSRLKSGRPTTLQPKADDGITKILKSEGMLPGEINAAIERLLEVGKIEIVDADGKDGRPKKTGSRGFVQCILPT